MHDQHDMTEPPTGGGGVVGSVTNLPFGGSPLSGVPSSSLYAYVYVSALPTEQPEQFSR